MENNTNFDKLGDFAKFAKLWIVSILIAGLAGWCLSASVNKVKFNDNDALTLVIKAKQKSDTIWTDCLIRRISESINHKTHRQMMKNLMLLEEAIGVAQQREEGIDCIEPLLVDRNLLIYKLDKLSKECQVDLNIIRYIPIEEREGFVRAVQAILEDYIRREQAANPSGRS